MMFRTQVEYSEIEKTMKSRASAVKNIESEVRFYSTEPNSLWQLYEKRRTAKSYPFSIRDKMRRKYPN